jgi:hypothetical protein
MEEAMNNNDSQTDLGALWQRQPLTPFNISTGEMHRKWKRLNRMRLIRDSLIYAVCFFEVIFFTYSIVARDSPPLLKFAFILIILGMAFLAFQIWVNRYSRKALRTQAEISASTDSANYLRLELIRERDFHRGAWFWTRLIALIPGLLVYVLWVIFTYPNQVFGYAIGIATSSIFVLAFWMNLKKSRQYQCQIDALDSLKQTPEQHAT